MDPLSRNPFIMQDCMPPVLPPPRSYYVVSWVPRALPEVVQLVKEIPNDAERSLINDHYELGMLVMRRCGVQNPEEIKCLLDGFREGTTRLAVKSNRNNNNNTELVQDGYWRHAGGAGPPVLERRKLLIFFNDHRASRPWVLCPAKHCIKSARTTGKVKGRVKIFQFDPRTCTAEVPKLFINCLADFMTADHYVFATFCPQQKYTDHELGWFDTSRKRFPGERGGDTVYRELLEDYDMKSAGRVWPFDDYIIFSNSQSKILGVFRKKQVPVYSRTTTSGSGEQALIDQNDDDRRSAGNPGMAAWECSSSSMAKHAEDVLVKIMARVLAHLDPCETSVPRSQTNNNNNQDTTNSIPSYGKIKSETTDDLPDNQSCCRDQDDQSCCSDDAGSSSTCRQKDGSSEPPSFGGVKRRRYSQVHSVPACIIGGGSSVSNGNTAAGLVIAPPSSQQQQPPQQQQQSAPIPPTVLTPKGLGPIRPPPCTHELVSQFINAVMVGLDQVQPCALRRVPEPIKRIVMK